MAPLGNWKTKIVVLIGVLYFFACTSNNHKTNVTIEKNTPENKNTATKEPKPFISVPDFNEDSAYSFVKKQVDFGPRVPNTPEHKKCAKYLENKLKSYGFNVIRQEFKARTFNGKQLEAINIIGAYNPEHQKRILLFAHWDSRPFADQDKKDKTKPILGANDGASGVGILLEVARQIAILKPDLGVDIIFFDAEDYGQPSETMLAQQSDTWCLGSQYWSKNPHKPNYKAEYGILLDMVGAPNAVFTKENISMQYAADVVNKVWGVANQIGFGNYFINQETYFLGTDDHQYVNQIAKIPSIDIIQYDSSTGSFGTYWHTHNDNMDAIDKNTLNAVGTTVLAVVLSES